MRSGRGSASERSLDNELELKHGETTETMEIEGEYSYDEDADDGAERVGKRARTHGIHETENDGGTKRMALGAAARVEEM